MEEPATMVTLLHTSDVHIGEYAREADRLAGLTGVVDLALQHRVDALLIAGDLFDNSRVSDESVRDALEQLSRLQIPVCISMGNHDSWERPSIYDRYHPGTAGPHIRFLSDPEGEHVWFEDLELAVWSRGMLAHTPENAPLLGYQALDGARWQVLMAHGHYRLATERDICSSPIYPEDIAALRCDYVALGHWHRRADVSSGGTPAFYSGSPSDEFVEAHSVNLIRLAAGAPTLVTHIPVPRPEAAAGSPR